MSSNVLLNTSALTCEKEENEDDDGCVAKVKYSGDKARDGQFGREIMDTIQEEIDGRKSTRKE